MRIYHGLASQETGYTSNAVISIDGKYYLDLMPVKYNIVVAFPNGTSQTYNYIIVERGTASETNIKYEQPTTLPLLCTIVKSDLVCSIRTDKQC
jgi:hypothetical protein